jgi:hypothetical protein
MRTGAGISQPLTEKDIPVVHPVVPKAANSSYSPYTNTALEEAALD